MPGLTLPTMNDYSSLHKLHFFLAFAFWREIMETLVPEGCIM